MTLRRTLVPFFPDIVIARNERAVRLAAVARRLPGSNLGKIPLVYRNGLEGSFKNKPLNRFLVSPRIDRHVTNILTKLDVPSRTAATTYAHDHKLF